MDSKTVKLNFGGVVKVVKKKVDYPFMSCKFGLLELLGYWFTYKLNASVVLSCLLLIA